MKITTKQMEAGLTKWIERHHPSIANIAKVKYSPRRAIIFEARKAQGGVKLTFGTRPDHPLFQFHLSEAVRALKEIHYETTHASSIRRLQAGAMEAESH